MFFPIATAGVEVQKRLETAIRDTWVMTLNLPENALSWMGLDFNPGNLGTWMESYINYGESQDSIFFGSGHGANVKTGILLLTLTTPKNNGARPSFEIMDAYQATFGRGNFDNIVTNVFDGPTILAHESVTRTQLTIAFYYYETH